MGQTGCPHDGKVDGNVMSTAHLSREHLQATWAGCTPILVHLGNAVMGRSAPPVPSALALRTRPWLRASSSRGGTAGPQLAAPAARRLEKLSRARGAEALNFFLPTTCLGFSFRTRCLVGWKGGCWYLCIHSDGCAWHTHTPERSLCVSGCVHALPGCRNVCGVCGHYLAPPGAQSCNPSVCTRARLMQTPHLHG